MKTNVCTYICVWLRAAAECILSLLLQHIQNWFVGERASLTFIAQHLVLILTFDLVDTSNCDSFFFIFVFKTFGVTVYFN